MRSLEVLRLQGRMASSSSHFSARLLAAAARLRVLECPVLVGDLQLLAGCPDLATLVLHVEGLEVGGIKRHGIFTLQIQGVKKGTA